jgi:hypothetical protein
MNDGTLRTPKQSVVISCKFRGCRALGETSCAARKGACNPALQPYVS